MPAEQIPQDVDDAAALYRSLLAERRVLILLDNAATVSQVRPLLPGTGTSLVVVTSRNRLSGLTVRDGARRLTLGTLPEPEAIALLHAVTSGYRPGDDEEKLTELARLCARLPLALRIAAERAASHPHMRIDDLISDLRDESALWDALSTGIDEEAEAVHSVFAWSYRALPASSARLFRLLGIHPGPEFSLHAAATLCEFSLSRTRQLLDDLVGAHLLEQTAPDRFQFHDLLRAFATGQAQSDEPVEQRNAALHRVLAWYLHTADAAQSWLRPSERHSLLTASTASVPPLVFADYDAAADWADREHTTLLHLVPAAVSAGIDTLAWQLAEVLWTARYPSAPGSDWIDRCVPVWRQPNDDHFERAAVFFRDADEPRRAAMALSNIASTRLDAGRLPEADEAAQQALAAHRALNNERSVGNALCIVAELCREQGELAAARRAIDEALDIALNLRSHVLEGFWLLTLGDIQRAAGHYGDALTSYQRSATLHRRLGDRSREALAWRGTGQTYAAMDRYDEAAAFHRQAAAVHGQLGDAWQHALELDHLAAAVEREDPPSGPRPPG
ncbi:tetratricopeptide repeat protein [Streptomyces endocoffeicus]|uniref:tetratricopeptide repeat protein n=1 Tax=Streptomyces endocoffeicus TaxID=2898945 RepID=UPI0027DCA477|nr:tetratricopeptide repeat protein [Streptomyces endocoffeicus]